MIHLFNYDHYNKIGTPEFLIDSFQYTKKIMTDLIITDKVLNKVAHNFINAQTTWAKMIVTNTTDVVKYFVDSNTKTLFPNKEA